MVYGIHSSFMIIGMVSVALRFVSRHKISAKIDKDDWLILAAVVSLNLLFSCFLNRGLLSQPAQREISSLACRQLFTSPGAAMSDKGCRPLFFSLFSGPCDKSDSP